MSIMAYFAKMATALVVLVFFVLGLIDGRGVDGNGNAVEGDSQDDKGVSKEELRRIRVGVKKAVDALTEAAPLFAFLPDKVKVRQNGKWMGRDDQLQIDLAKGQRNRVSGELDEFLDLPPEIQERMLATVLARSRPDARKTFERNASVLEAVGLGHLDLERVAHEANRLARTRKGRT